MHMWVCVYVYDPELQKTGKSMLTKTPYTNPLCICDWQDPIQHLSLYVEELCFIT